MLGLFHNMLPKSKATLNRFKFFTSIQTNVGNHRPGFNTENNEGVLGTAVMAIVPSIIGNIRSNGCPSAMGKMGVTNGGNHAL